MRYHAYRNRCEHKGQGLDPMPGEDKIQCCSVGKATYDYEGKIMAGPADGAVAAYRVDMNEGKLVVTIVP
jgi:nitrite reductase/ring-hydroxylating ferredoxin subunit